MEHMRRFVFCIVFFGFSVLFFSPSLYAHSSELVSHSSPPPSPSSGHRSDLRSMKIAFLTDALQLTPSESEQFWPVYNEYWRARKEVSRRRHEVYKVIREGHAGSQQFSDLLSVMDSERTIAAEYMARFQQILPASKAARVFVADEDFKNFLVRRATGVGGPHK